MRIAFCETLLNFAKKDKRIILLTADLGFSVFEEFIRELPEQFINVGVAEQNMTGIAAGLAMEGKTPLIYSIIPFVTMRNFEQIRNDICYQNLNVKIVGIGAGFSYGPYGHTHHGLEDIGVLRSLPNMVILAPGDPLEAKLATKEALKYKGPVYLRLGKKGEPVIHQKHPRFKIGKGIIIEKGTDITIIACSTMLETAFKTGQMLKNKGLSVNLVSMPSIKPLDENLILECAKITKAIFTIEEHFLIGGLGSAVAEVLAESNTSIIFKRIAVPDRFTKVIGLQEYMRKANGLSCDQIVETIRRNLDEK